MVIDRRFAIDWKTPKGSPGNGNPLSVLYSENQFTSLEDDIGRMTPFAINHESPLSRALKASHHMLHDIMYGRGKFIYEMIVVGGIQNALGQWPIQSHRALFQNVSPEAKAACRDGKALFLINASYEGDPVKSLEVFTHIHREIKIENLPEDGVVFLTSNLKCEKLYTEWLADKKVAPIRAVSVNMWEYLVQENYRHSLDQFLSKELASSSRMRNKHFLCFNRRAHQHRQILTSQILAMGMADKFLLSMADPRLGQFSEHVNTYEWKSVFPNIEADMELLLATVPLIVDTDDFDTNHAFTNVKEPYLDSYINIVSETQFRNYGVDELMFFSEKTFKPIVNFQPFIIVGAKGSLATLRDLGYQTFSPFIDESYDDIEDDFLRLQAIVNEIQRLSQISTSELDRWYQDIFTILVDNQKLFLARDAIAGIRSVVDRFVRRFKTI